MSWECVVCGKKNPDKARVCRRKYRREACFGVDLDSDFDFIRKYIAFLTMMCNMSENLNSGVIQS